MMLIYTDSPVTPPSKAYFHWILAIGIQYVKKSNWNFVVKLDTEIYYKSRITYLWTQLMQFVVEFLVIL